MQLYFTTSPSDFRKVAERWLTRSLDHGLRWDAVVYNDARRTMTLSVDVSAASELPELVSVFVAQFGFPTYTLSVLEA